MRFLVALLGGGIAGYAIWWTLDKFQPCYSIADALNRMESTDGQDDDEAI